MALECSHNFRQDQMVWAKFSETGGFWPAIISRDETRDEARGSWSIGDDIHVQFVSPPFVRAYGQVIKERWVNAYNELVSFELLKKSEELFSSNNIRNAYLEAVEIFKEGKALPRWVENVVITASKIKGCSIDEEDVDDEDEDSDMSPRENLDPSCEINGHSTFKREKESTKEKINGKRRSTDSYYSDTSSSISDANQNKKMRRETKHSHSKKSKQSKVIIENGTKPQIEEDKVNHHVFNGSESAIMQYMVKTENRWQCRACDFVSTSKNEANCKQNLKKHIRTSHSKSVKPTSTGLA